jgi:hypothetical protein
MRTETTLDPNALPVFQDDRTPEQKQTHRLAWVMTDSFLSGWGHAKNGLSYAGWAFRDADTYAVERWVRSRSDSRRVRLVVLDGYRPTGAAHTHIYVVEPGHPALA